MPGGNELSRSPLAWAAALAAEGAPVHTIAQIMARGPAAGRPPGGGQVVPGVRRLAVGRGSHQGLEVATKVLDKNAVLLSAGPERVSSTSWYSAAQRASTSAAMRGANRCKPCHLTKDVEEKLVDH